MYSISQLNDLKSLTRQITTAKKGWINTNDSDEKSKYHDQANSARDKIQSIINDPKGNVVTGSDLGRLYKLMVDVKSPTIEWSKYNKVAATAEAMINGLITDYNNNKNNSNNVLVNLSTNSGGNNASNNTVAINPSPVPLGSISKNDILDNPRVIGVGQDGEPILDSTFSKVGCVDNGSKGSGIGSKFAYEWKTNNTPHVTDEFLQEVYNISQRHGINQDDLMAVMAWESWIDPSIKNSIGATGLVQFMPNTATAMGTTTTDLKEMTAVEQLEYVEKYLFELSAWAGTPKTLEDLYMIILWPKAVGKGSSYVMWEKGGTNNMEYVQNAPLDLDGDGKIIVSEAIKKVIDRRDNNFKKK